MNGSLLVFGDIAKVDDSFLGGLEGGVFPLGMKREMIVLHYKDTNNSGLSSHILYY